MSPVERELIEFVCPDEVAPRPLRVPFADEPLPGRPLAGAVEAGNGAALIALPAGWRGGRTSGHAFELVVLEGALDVAGDALPAGGYLSVAAGERCPPLACGDGGLAWVDAIADVTETKVVPPSDEGWSDRALVPGPPPGLTRRMIRGELDTARGFFLRIPAGWREERTEWHDCAEACLVIEGDLWHVRAKGGAGGTMRRHCYFWRPKHVLHSPMGSHDGAFMYISVDGQLVNHYLERGETPPGMDPGAPARRSAAPPP
jgi:hypothetical protein